MVTHHPAFYTRVKPSTNLKKQIYEKKVETFSLHGK
jgi:hypothetical protein